MIEQHRNPNGTVDGIGVLADLAGISQLDTATIWAEAQANGERLRACPYHEFAPILPLSLIHI